MKDTKAAHSQFTIVAIDTMLGSTISGRYSPIIGPIVKLNTALKQIRLTIMMTLGQVTISSELDL